MAVVRINQDAGHGAGGIFAVQNTDFVIDKLDIAQRRIFGQQGLTQRQVKRIHRPVAFGGGMHHIAIDIQLNHRFGQLAAAAAVFHNHREIKQGEERLIVGPRSMQARRHRSLGAFKGKALIFQFFDVGKHLKRLVFGYIQAKLFGFAKQIAASRQVGDEDSGLVADLLRFNVLVAIDIAPHRRHMNTALVGKGAAADVGQMRIGRQVGNFGHGARQVGQGVKVSVLGQAGNAHLEHKVGDDTAQVGVAAAFAIAVDGPLHMNGAGADGRQRIGDGEFTVVMRVDAKLHLREQFAGLMHKISDFPRHGAAVGVAKRDGISAAGRRRRQGVKAVLHIQFRAIEKMFSVIDDFFAQVLEIGDAVTNHAEIFGGRRLQHIGHVEH